MPFKKCCKWGVWGRNENFSQKKIVNTGRRRWRFFFRESINYANSYLPQHFARPQQSETKKKMRITWKLISSINVHSTLFFHSIISLSIVESSTGCCCACLPVSFCMSCNDSIIRSWVNKIKVFIRIYKHENFFSSSSSSPFQLRFAEVTQNGNCRVTLTTSFIQVGWVPFFRNSPGKLHFLSSTQLAKEWGVGKLLSSSLSEKNYRLGNNLAETMPCEEM